MVSQEVVILAEVGEQMSSILARFFRPHGVRHDEEGLEKMFKSPKILWKMPLGI